MDRAVQFLISASAGFLAAAVKDVGGQSKSGWSSRKVGDDAAIVRDLGLSLSELAGLCRSVPLPFVRHLTEVHAIVPVERVADAIDKALMPLPEIVAARNGGAAIGLHSWVAEGVAADGTDGLAPMLRAHLEANGLQVVRRDYEFALHACLSREGVVLGAASRADSLADWPGGRIRLGADPLQVSRAERKLEEAIAVFGLPLRSGAVAIDLGASPGGWTRVLSRRGLKVYAVDPAELAPSVAVDPNVSHQRMKAQDFLKAAPDKVDLIVNDMRMEPLESCHIMVECAAQLKADGYGVLTLKLAANANARSIRDALAILRSGYGKIEARQLYHNRKEATVVLREPRR